MIYDLKPYPAYKDSGVPWLATVPEHWEIKKLKHLTRFYNGLAFKPSDWSNHGIPIIRIQNLNGSEQFNYTTKQNLPDFLLIRHGNLLFSWSGNRGTSFGPFIWKRHFAGYLNQHIFKLDGFNLNRLYFFHVLCALTRHVEEETHGIIGLVHITKPELGNTCVPVAPPLEQAAIARFLDCSGQRIARYVQAKRKLIKLLDERKQAIIQRAVTRGLDPNVRFKPIGLEWLGDVPEHWEVNRAKSLFREIDERSENGTEELLSVSHVTGVTPRSEKNITMFMAESYTGHKLCCPGDLVINTMWAWMGALGVSRHIGIVSPAYGVYRPLQSDKLLPQFADLLLRTRPYTDEYMCRSTGIRGSRLRLYPEQFLRIPIALPPPSEQQAILNAIQTATRELNSAIEAARQEVSFLHEFRTRLIADVVTGKLDVRAAAVRLSDEVLEPEVLDDETAAVNEGDLVDPDADLDAASEEALA